MELLIYEEVALNRNLKKISIERATLFREILANLNRILGCSGVDSFECKFFVCT